MFKALSIRWKILAGLLALAILPMLLLTYLFSNMTREQVRDQMDLMADQAGRFIIQTAAHNEEQLTEALELMAQDSNLLTAVAGFTNTQESVLLEAFARTYRAQFGFDRIDILWVDGSRQVLTSSGSLALPDNALPRPAEGKIFNSASSGIIAAGHQLHIYCTVPLKLEEQIFGSLVGYRSMNDLMANQFQVMVEAEVAFHDGQQVTASSLPVLKSKTLDLEAILEEDAVVIDLDGRSQVLYNYPLNHPKAGFLLAMDRSPIILANKNLQRTLMMITIGVAALATLIGLLISSGIARPLYSVVNNLQEIAEGEADLTRTLNVSGEDEVGLLAGSFNRFIARLREMVELTVKTALSLSTATHAIRDRFSDVNRNAMEQTQALESAHQSVTEIDSTAIEIADNVSTLVASVQQSAAATHQLESTTLSISEQMENLFGIISDTSTSIHDLSSSNEQIDANILELSASARQTSNSVESLEQATSTIEKGAEQTSQLAQQAVTQAQEGKAAVQDTIRGISGLQQLIEQAHLAIRELGERSDSIGNIVNVIAEVADQTNLLALNAAIIAAQAGEHGQGFAVVAEEIRSLAERTSVSTQEIADIVENLQQGTNTAMTTIEAGSVRAHQEVARSQVAGEALEKLHQSSLQSTEQITSIARETQRQSEENRKITQAVLGITGMLERISQSISQQTASTRNLSTAAESMKTIAGRVKRSTFEQQRGSQQIAQSMEHIQQMIELIDSATRQQSQRCSEVVAAVARVRQIADENAGQASDMDQVVEELSEQARSLASQMGAFKV